MKNIIDKRGSYTVEAALSLPVLILCICALVLIIRIVAVCESVCFYSGREMMEISLGAYRHVNSVSLCDEMEETVGEESGLSDFKITGFRYLYNDGEFTDLIEVQSRARFKVVNAVGINGKIEFTHSILARGFTGAIQDGDPLSEDEFCNGESSQPVFVFPRYGKRYHRPGCRYVKQEIKGNSYKLKMEKDDAVGKGYTACKICGGAANVR